MFVSWLVVLVILSGLWSSVVAQDPVYQEEMRTLMAHPAVRNAFAAIEALEPRTHQDLITLTQIPAPPFQEEERAQRYAEMLSAAGVDTVYIDEVGNVIALRRGTGGGRTVALVGHMDTVFPEGTDVTVRQRGDTLFAPGIGDDTRGLIVVLSVLRALNAADIRTTADLMFVGSVGEEGLGDLRGVKHLFRDGGPRVDAFIAVDGGGIGSIVNRGLGSHRYRVTISGPGGHSWGAFGFANPAHALGRAVHVFDDAARAFVASGARTSYNVGRIGGGTSINSIPFSVWMEVDMRSESPDRLLTIDSIFKAAMTAAVQEQNAHRASGDSLSLLLEMIGDRPSGEIDPATPLVGRAVASATLLGATTTELSIGSTDSNIPIALGVPAVTIGRGGQGSGGHSLREWWINEDGHLAIRNALMILVAEAGLAAGVP